MGLRVFLPIPRTRDRGEYRRQISLYYMHSSRVDEWYVASAITLGETAKQSGVSSLCPGTWWAPYHRAVCSGCKPCMLECVYVMSLYG